MTDVEWEKYLRSLLNEATARFWTTDDIASLKKVGMILTFAAFWNLLVPTHKTYKAISLQANISEYTLPDDYFKALKMEIVSTGRRLAYIHEGQLHHIDPGSGPPVAWMFYNKKIKFFPTPEVAAADYYRFWYLPRFAVLDDFPEELHPLIAVEALIGAKIKDEDLTADLQVLQKRYADAATIALAVEQLQEPSVWSDEDSDESLGS